MTSNLLKVIEDNIEPLKNNKKAQTLLNIFINKILDSKDRDKYNTYIINNKIEFIKSTSRSSKETTGFIIKNNTDFSFYYYNYGLGNSNYILQSYELSFKNNKIVSGKAGEWYYEKKKSFFVSSILDMITKDKAPTSYYQQFGKTKEQLYNFSNTIVNSYHTLEIDNEDNNYKYNLNGHIDKKTITSNRNILELFTNFLEEDLSILEYSTTSYQALNSFDNLKENLEKIKNAREKRYIFINKKRIKGES